VKRWCALPEKFNVYRKVLIASPERGVFADGLAVLS